MEDYLAFNQWLKENSEIQDNFDFVVGPKSLSRVSELSWQDCIEIAKGLKNVKGLGKVFLQWDVLMTESHFKGLSTLLKGHWDDFLLYFQGIRVQDAGSLVWLKEQQYTGEVHYICENGNHNLRGLLSWYEYWPEKISRLVLSAEFPAETLNELKEKIPCEIEVLGAGNILLFYTPRHLVAPLYQDSGEDLEEFRVSGTSEESPHKGFPIIDNGHGTFMFNTKELYIFTEEERLQELTNLYFRIDYPIDALSFNQWSMLLLKEHQSFQESRALGQTKGFFRTNKTDVLFKKLKNHRLQDRGDHYLGDVVDVKKNQHIAVLIKGKNKVIKAGDELKLLSPEGREKFVSLKRIWNADREEMNQAESGQIVFIPHVGGISVRTMVFIK